MNEPDRSSSVFDVRRLLSLVGPLAAIILALVLCDRLAYTTYQMASPSQVAVDFLDVDRQAALGRRIASVEAIMQVQKYRGLELCVLLGQSTMREGIDVDILDKSLPLNFRSLNLGASGGSFLQLRFYAQPLLTSHLEPALVVVGAHAQWLANPLAQIDDQRVRLAAGGGDAALGQLWSWRERNSLRNLATYALSGARRRVMSVLGQTTLLQIAPGRGEGFAQDGAPAENPWHAPHKYRGSHASKGHVARMLDVGTSYGWFEPGAYDADGIENRALLKLLVALGERSQSMVLVLMPEHSTLRGSVPPIAGTLLPEVLETYRHETHRDITLLDHRSTIEDDAFFDPAHLNAAGRETYSAILGKALVPIVSGLR